VTFQIYHQLGHNYVWNLDSIRDDSTGDGVIIGPRSMERAKVEALDPKIRRAAIFDPQFFLPDLPKGKLDTYDFFPEIAADGFESDEFPETSAAVSADGCVKFQISSNFRYVTIPTRYAGGMPSDFIESQERLFVNPFLEACSDQGCKKKVILQLVLNDNMLKDEEYSADILNWATGFDGIRGIYIIAETSSLSKQVKDSDFLYNLLRFIARLRLNNLTVIVGYLNTESIVLSLADPQIVTIGAYENTRAFHIRTFQEGTGRQQGPRPRLYLSRALQWIDRGYHGAIIRRYPDGATLFDRNKYQALMFKPTFKWHFMKPELYKHHFLELSRQLRRVAATGGRERYRYVVSLIEEAMHVHERMAHAGIILNGDNDGSHLGAWLTAANEFAQDKGWV